MKKIKSPTFIILLLFILSMNKSFSQVVYAKAEEFKELKKRTLIVQLLEEDKSAIEKMEKNIAKEKKPDKKEAAQKELDDIRTFIKGYNEYIKTAVTKYWDLNEKVEYKTISEVKKLRESKSNKYTVLFYSESMNDRTDAYGFRYAPTLFIPTFNYSRIEEGTVKIDYSFFMCSTNHGKMSYGDVAFSLLLMKNHIAEIEKSGKKKYTFREYASDEGKKNCDSIKGKTFNMDKKQIHSKTDEKELKEKFTNGTLNFVTTDELILAIENEENAIYGFTIPNTIAAGSMGPLTASRITFYRCFINVKTGKIYSCKGDSMGEFNDNYFRPKEIGDLGNCN